jgi:WD40 repeat protein
VGWETVHVFVSSTFNDMHGERDYLVKEVFPELRDWCEERKLRLVDIDLRWGVSEADATHNQRVVEVCLQNIDRCRPFFLCFLGQRYGWIPGAGDVSAETLARYPGLKAAIVEQRSVTELEVLHAVVAPFVGGEAKLAAGQSFLYLRDDDYLKDMPAEPVQLKRIYSDEGEEDAQSRAFLVDRQNKLRAAVVAQKARPVRQYSARWLIDRHTPELSMPLDCPATLRENQDRWRRDWQRSGEVSVPEGALSVPAAQAEKARAYNQRLCAGRLGDFWSDGRSFTEVIVDDLKAAILERYPERKELPEQDDLTREIDRHEDFVRTAADVFIERPGDFADLDAYAAGDSRKLFVLVAKAGLGKSTLLANWVARWRSRDGGLANETVHARFVGVGEQSGTVDALLRSILEELQRTAKWPTERDRQRPDAVERKVEIPDDANVLRSKFCELLGECGKEGRTVVVIDALNQLQSGLSDLDWLARTLPENVKLVVSFKLGDATVDALAAQLRADERVTLSEVRPFAGLEERRQLVRQFLRQFLKELDEQHLEALIQADGADNPLFLKVVLTELRVFGAFGQLGEMIRREFGTTPQSAFEAVLRRLESDPSYAAVPSQQAAPLLFGLLAHSRSGLPEDLLARMFLAELGLGEERLADTEATIQLFLRQVRPFLARREGRVDFFYESFQLAALRRYTPSGPLSHEVGEGQGEGPSPRPAAAWHGQLARACDGWRTLTEASRRYALGNLAQHHVAAGQANQAAEALTAFGYHYERLKALGREDVVNVTADFALVDGAAGLVPAVRERFGVWGAFHAENAHLLRRDVPHLAPHTYLLQLAAAHADTSPVTESAESWLETVGSEAHWLRSLRRPRERERSACVRTFEGHTDEVRAVSLLPDGKRAISGSRDATVKLWDLETGQCLRTFQGHTSAVNAVAPLPDGKCALSGSGDNTLKLWDLETGQCLRTLQENRDWAWANAVAPLPNGKRAISGNRDATVKLWDLETGQCLRTFQGHTSGVLAVAPLPDGKRALSGSHKTVKLWDLETGQCLRTLQGHTSDVEAVAPLPDGKRALSGSWDTLKLWDLETGQCLRTLEGGRAVAVLPDGKRALSGSYKTLKLWDLETGQCLRTLEGGRAVAVLPDGKRALSGSRKTLKLWDLETGQCLRTLQGHGHWVEAVAALPDGKRAISGGESRDRTLKLWDLETGQCLRTLQGHTRGVEAVAPLPDGKRAISASSDKTLKLWNLETGRCLRTLRGHRHWVEAVALLPDGRRALSGSADKTVKLWDLETGQCLRTLQGHTSGVEAVAPLPDGKRAISASSDKTLKLWDLETGQCLRTLQGHTSGVEAVAPLPDGKRAISASSDKTLKLWDLETGQCRLTFAGHTSEVLAVALLPDGKRALSCAGTLARTIRGFDYHHALKLWDIETGQCLRTFEGHSDSVEAMALLPDGRRALSGSADKTLKLWDLETGQCLATWQAESAVRRCAAVLDTIVAGTGTGSVLLETGTDGGEVLLLKLVPPGRVVPETIAVAWHPSRPFLAVGRANGRLSIQAWHPESQFLEELARSASPLLAHLQWSTDGAHLLAAARDGTTHVLEAETLHEVSIPAQRWTDRIRRALRLSGLGPVFAWSAPRDISSDGRWRAVIEAGQLRIVPATEA